LAKSRTLLHFRIEEFGFFFVLLVDVLVIGAITDVFVKVFYLLDEKGLVLLG